jgi:hypothetical protein
LIWEQIKEVAQGVSPYYAPDLWMPHITLGYGDITNANLGCAMDALAFRDFNWQIDVDNLTFIGEFDQNLYGTCCTFRLGE